MNNKTSDKNVANIEEMNFKRELLQRPISYLTEENLDKLETHCLKAIRYEVGIEHKVVLELLERHKEYLAEREQDKKRIKELEEENYVQKIQIYENYIPKQVVIDTMEELNNEIKNGDEIEAIFKIKQQQILQELLERGNK